MFSEKLHRHSLRLLRMTLIPEASPVHFPACGMFFGLLVGLGMVDHLLVSFSKIPPPRYPNSTPLIIDQQTRR